MNSPRSPKEAFSELPQLLLERSEHDDDTTDRRPSCERLNTVREVAAISVSQWQWKFWKKSSPTLRHKQRKYPLPGTALTPLPASTSPGRLNSNSNALEKLVDDIADRKVAESPAQQPPSAEMSATNDPLPPLEMEILQRPRLFLDVNGSPTVVVDQLVRLQEYHEQVLPSNALQLVAIPKKCLNGDEIALMPCHSLQHRGYTRISAEQWREPVRDRDKHWLQDELPALVRGDLNYFQTTAWSMTKAPGLNNRGKWARYESYRFSVASRLTGQFDNPASPTSSAKRPPRVLLRAQGALISCSYCVVSIFGEGIYGRLYGAGLTGKNKKRCLRVEAYEPATSQTYYLPLSLQDIEWVFRAGGNDPEREALLAPGKKQELLQQLITLLYFDYPDDSDSGAVSYRNANNEPSMREDVVKVPKTRIQVLKVSPEIQLNESALRRLEREERLRQDEAQRLEDLAALHAKPRRARYRVLCQQIRLRGRHFYVSIYHYPAQARNLVVTAYNPDASMTYRLTIGLLEAASLIRLYPYPRSGFSPEQTLTVARGLIPWLRLNGREDIRSNARMMLAISGGRQGPGANALPRLAPLMTEENQRDELFNKMLRDSQRSLQIELEMAHFRLHNDAEAERAELRQKMTNLESKRAEIYEKDQAHKIRIEEIDAAGGNGASVDVKALHEERRSRKTSRQALKAELKSIAAKLAELNQKLKDVSEKAKTAGERAQRRADRARKRIREDVFQTITATLQPAMPLSQHRPKGQRTWLARVHMQPGRCLLSSGGCRVSGRRVRYSLFVLESAITDTLDTADSDTQLFSLELYDPQVCLTYTSFVFSKLEWIALTKCCHDQQQLVPELAPPTSTVANRLIELRENTVETRRTLFAISNRPPATSSKGKAPKTKASSNNKKREELFYTMKTTSNEIHKLSREAPWSALVKPLCERCIITSNADATALDVTLDRCIFRCVSPVLRITNDDNEDDTVGDSGAVYCRVRVEVLPLAQAVVYDVWDPLDGTQWRIEYPESRELLREFAVETFIEQQMHLEAITMSLLLHLNTETGRLELRFEE